MQYSRFVKICTTSSSNFRRLAADTRHPSDRWLWIDQISIDQANVEERNHQVQMMGRIYRAAAAVIVWLGLGDGPVLRVEGDSQDICTEHQAAKAFKKTGEHCFLTIILRNEYFSRLWIVQEFLLARDLRLLMNDEWVLDNAGVISWGEWVGTPSYKDNTYVSLGCAQMFRNRTNELRYMELTRTLNSFGRNACSDPRDKIYGLLGLVESTPDRLDQDQIVIDYAKLPQDVLMDVLLIELKDRHWRAMYDDYYAGFSFTEGDPMDWFSRVFTKLALQMDCSSTQADSLRVFLWALSSDERLYHFVGYDFPISAMGFNQADGRPSSIDKWWFDFQGERYFVECLDSPSVESFNDKTRRLLSESWEKYLLPTDRNKRVTEGEATTALEGPV